METTEFTSDHYQPISKAYDGKCIFVTGCSGFLGKVFLEKILYSCPKIEKVYVLLRDMEKASAEVKLKNMLDCPLFKRLKTERPQDLEKITIIKGDICKPNLGISTEDENILIENVSMVFHFAATVRFNDPLNVHLNCNFEGTRRILDLCVKLRNIEIFVYVSTAYSNSNRTIIEETLYPPVIPLTEVAKFMKEQSLTTEQIKRILNGMPNMYTVSKNLAENLVAEFHKKHNFPITIIRPSIVIARKDEPVSGWVDNWFGPTALVVAIDKGVIRAIGSDGNNVIDLIPVDYVANLVIVIGARSRRVENLEVYNCCSSTTNPITLQNITDFIKDQGKSSFVFLPNVMYIKWRWIMILLTFLLETIPAYLADCFSRVFGKKIIYMRMLSKMHGVREALEPFTSRTWMIKSQKTAALAKSLSPDDRRVFAFDATSINWNEVIPTYLRGIQLYLLNNKK